MQLPPSQPPDTTPPKSPSNLFDVPDPDEEALAELRRTNRRRIALLGIGTGIVMALLVLLCVALLVAAQNS